MQNGPKNPQGERVPAADPLTAALAAALRPVALEMARAIVADLAAQPAKPVPLMNAKEVCEYLSISEPTLRKLRDEEGMPARRVGDVFRYSKEEIDTWTAGKAKAS